METYIATWFHGVKVYYDYTEALTAIMTGNVMFVVRDTVKPEDLFRSMFPYIVTGWRVQWELEQDGYLVPSHGDWFEVIS